MNGRLSEFTLAQVLQFCALAERAGTIVVRAGERVSRLLVEGDRVTGWGLPEYDVREALLGCEMLPPRAVDALRSVVPREETPGLSFVTRNLIEPERWDAFAQRQLEQDVYPLLNEQEGDFDVEVGAVPPAPIRFSLAVNSIILDGSRWESEMEAAQLEGYALTSAWRRTTASFIVDPVRLSRFEWMVWAVLLERQTIAGIANRLGLPDLTTIGSIRRLHSSGLIHRAD